MWPRLGFLFPSRDGGSKGTHLLQASPASPWIHLASPTAQAARGGGCDPGSSAPTNSLGQVSLQGRGRWQYFVFDLVFWTHILLKLVHQDGFLEAQASILVVSWAARLRFLVGRAQQRDFVSCTSDRFKGSMVITTALGRRFLGAHAQRLQDCHRQGQAGSGRGAVTATRR